MPLREVIVPKEVQRIWNKHAHIQYEMIMYSVKNVESVHVENEREPTTAQGVFRLRGQKGLYKLFKPHVHCKETKKYVSKHKLHNTIFFLKKTIVLFYTDTWKGSKATVKTVTKYLSSN